MLFANAGPGTRSYNNLVVGNYIAGNELAGVTMHAHATPPGAFEDLSGNRIVGTSSVTTTPVATRSTHPASRSRHRTTGVLVFAATVPVRVTIKRNLIFGNQFGIWLGIGGNVKATIARNSFHTSTSASSGTVGPPP